MATQTRRVSVKGKTKPKVNQRKSDPSHDLTLSIDLFHSDLDCMKEMFQAVLPMLEKQDAERSSKLDASLTTLVSHANKMRRVKSDLHPN